MQQQQQPAIRGFAPAVMRFDNCLLIFRLQKRCCAVIAPLEAAGAHYFCGLPRFCGNKSYPKMGQNHAHDCKCFPYQNAIKAIWGRAGG